MNIQALALLLIAIPNFVLGSIILVRNTKNTNNIFFTSFAFTVGLWTLGLAGYLSSTNNGAATVWAQFYYIVAAFIALSFLAFSLSFTGSWKKLSLIKKLLLTSIPVLGSVLIATVPSILITDIATRLWGKEVVLNHTGYLVYAVVLVAYVLIGFSAILRKFLKAKGTEKIYLKLILSGLSVAFILGVAFNFIFPYLGNYRYIWVGPLFTFAYVMITFYAIIKLKLFDIKLILVRALAYLLSVFIIASIFGFTVFNLLSSVLFKDNVFPLSQKTFYVFLFIALAVLFQPIKQYFDKITKKIFFKEKYDPQDLIDKLNKTLVNSVELEELLTKSALVIQENLKAAFTTFFIRETSYFPDRVIGAHRKEPEVDNMDDLQVLASKLKKKVFIVDDNPTNENEKKLAKILKDNDIQVLARLVTNNDYGVKGIGYVLVGGKKSGAIYSSQDVKILEIITNELVIAIENTLRFEEIEQFNVTLQKKIDDATKELKTSNDKLKALDEAKDEFVSMASHQLRTPLTSIKGYISMVLEGDAGKITETQSKMLGQAFFSSQRMVYLISDLLNVSRLKTGKFNIDTRPVYLPDLVESEVNQLYEGAKNKDITLTFTKPTSFTTLKLDDMKIRQVVMNFTDNAIYYTPAGGKIKVELKDNPKSVEFTVKDTGIGVPKNDKHKLFTKFYRADNARKARPDGTGLGLFMAKKVIVAQGGALIFDSKEGKGSTFGFSFPKDKLEAVEPEKPAK